MNQINKDTDNDHVVICHEYIWVESKREERYHIFHGPDTYLNCKNIAKFLNYSDSCYMGGDFYNVKLDDFLSGEWKNLNGL